VPMESGEVTLAGFCKGAGMIAPDMATMLCFMFTDAPIAQPVLQRLLASTADRTFNCITIDGDTSTSDTVLLFATGQASERGIREIRDAADPMLAPFAEALHSLMHELALAIVKDGEGLSKFVTVEVLGAEDDYAARRIAFSIANSPILKTAIAGEDPYMGALVRAVGKSGEAVYCDRLAIWFGPHLVARDGERASEYSVSVDANFMLNPEYPIRVEVGVGRGRATVWTCVLTLHY